MRPQDVLKFTNARIAKYTKLHDESMERFNEYKKKKDESFLYKLFRKKYERGMYEYWDFDKFSYWISQLEEIKTSAEYYNKISAVDMFDKFPKDWRKNFYNWCKENGIP